ncbi:MAG TPA: Flp family type IVb pilin [Microlunatus sp.]|nr:Flp family type IVb pilin [Microlunatus sp.]
MSNAFAYLVSFLTGKFDSKDRGATAVEYGLMVSLIAVVIIGAVTAIGVNLDGLFNTVAGAL